jgi:cell division protein FtsN
MDIGKEIIGGVVFTMIVIILLIVLNTFQKSIEESPIDSNTKQITSNIIENAKTSVWTYYILIDAIGIISLGLILIKLLGK